MTSHRVEFGRPSAPQMMPGGFGFATRSEVLGEFGGGGADPNGGATNAGEATGQVFDNLREYGELIADTA